MTNNEGIGGEPPSGTPEETQAGPRSEGQTSRSPWLEMARRQSGLYAVARTSAPIEFDELSHHAKLSLDGTVGASAQE